MSIMNSYQDLLAANVKWWNTPGSLGENHPLGWVCSGYDRDDILDENECSSDLVRLNNYVITIDSQDHTSDTIDDGTLLHEDYVKEYKLEHLKNYLSYSIQRPYIEFVTDNYTAEKIFNKVLSIPDIGIHCTSSKYLNTYSDNVFNIEVHNGVIPLTVINFPDAKRWSVQTSCSLRGLEQVKEYLKDIPCSDTLVSCTIYYTKWCDSLNAYHIPEGYEQSELENPTQYLINTILS